MARFRLLHGQHVAADKSRPVHGPDGKPTGRFASKTYHQGDVVESDTDLVARFGPEKFAYADRDQGDKERIAQLEAELAKLKGERARGPALMTPGEPTAIQGPATFPGGQVSGGARGGVDAADARPQAQGWEEDIEHMTRDELRSYAAREEIDLGGARTKDEILQAIRESRRG